MALRHCAYCLKEIEQVKTCGGCLKRSYCSRECQVTDWGAKGQCHRIWCKERICEEDIDWEIREAPNNKGLGVFAKRLLPKYTKIMVDRGYRKIDEAPLPFIESLMPHPGTLQEKWDLNSFFTTDAGDNLGIRLARVNHDCRNNSINKFVLDLNVFVLVANQDIQEGEEITIQYYFYNDFSTNKLYRDSRPEIIKDKWDVVCDDTCICRDQEALEKIQKAHELDCLIPTLPIRNEEQIKKSLQKVDELLAMGEDNSTGVMGKARTYYDGFQISITNRKTFPLHKSYIENYLKACEIIDTKHSVNYQEALRYFEHPQLHRNHFSK